MLYDLRRANVRVRWLVTCLLATFGLAYSFGGWMVALYAGFSPGRVADTYASPEMQMAMPPESTVVVEHPMSMSEFGKADVHAVDMSLLIQDSHVHVPMYGVIAAVLSIVVLGLALPRGWHIGLITLLFAAPWLDFAGMWLTKFVARGFAAVTIAGGWAMGLGYLLVTVVAIRQMWFTKGGTP